MKIKRIRYSRKRIFLCLFLFLVLLGLGIGFAYVTTKLSIEGVATVKDAKWNIHFANFSAMTGSVSPTTEPSVGTDTITFSAKVNEPGEFYGFTVDVVNEGTINAELADFSVTPDFSTIEYIDSTITYNNGDSIQTGDLLLANKSKKIKVLLKYKDGIDESLYPTEDQSYSVTLTIRYQQFIGDVPEANFATDSWNKIIDAYEGGSITQLTADMNAGTTREVELDLDNDPSTEPTIAHLRIANLSTPSECSTTGFSQTACGFVLEFTDIITTHRMNPYTDGTTNGDGNKGGWEYSELRTYLNTDIYNALPSKLSSKIINTSVVSGHGSNDSSNFTTTDKLYLLDVKEIYGDSFTSSDNVAKDVERQLDYYSNKGVNSSNYSDVVKNKIEDGNPFFWWLRSPISSEDAFFFGIMYNGYWGSLRSTENFGVSPAFRIS